MQGAIRPLIVPVELKVKGSGGRSPVWVKVKGIFTWDHLVDGNICDIP